MSKKINTKYLIIISSFAVVLAFALLGRTITKFIENEKKESLYEAQSFYFKSDTLSDSSVVPSFTLGRGQNSISINLNNYEDNLRYSDVSIDYVVTITDSNGNSVTDKNGNTITEKNGSFAKAQKQIKSIEFTNLVSGTYVVTAQAVSPYTKTIRATYKVTENDYAIKYTVSDTAGSNVLQLTVTTDDFSGDLNISWPAGLAPDSTDSKFLNVNTGFSSGSCTVNFNANSEYTFQFFKQDPSHKYVKEDFSVGE